MIIANLTLKKGDVYFEPKSKLLIAIKQIDFDLVTCFLTPSGKPEEELKQLSVGSVFRYRYSFVPHLLYITDIDVSNEIVNLNLQLG